MGKILSGGPKGPSKAERAAKAAADKRQADELAKLTREEDQRTAAASRKKRGRASLISGEETGLSDTLGG